MAEDLATPRYDTILCETILFDVHYNAGNGNKCLANAKRPCDCSVLCLRSKSSLCSCPHSILDMMSFGSVRRASMHVDATKGRSV